jgi:hypothetical protein
MTKKKADWETIPPIQDTPQQRAREKQLFGDIGRFMQKTETSLMKIHPKKRKRETEEKKNTEQKIQYIKMTVVKEDQIVMTSIYYDKSTGIVYNWNVYFIQWTGNEKALEKAIELQKKISVDDDEPLLIRFHYKKKYTEQEVDTCIRLAENTDKSKQWFLNIRGKECIPRQTYTKLSGLIDLDSISQQKGWPVTYLQQFQTPKELFQTRA